MTRLSSRQVISCPHCQQLAVKKGVASFSSSDLTRWSDGFVSSWFWGVSFARCRSCQGVYWLEDAAWVGDIPYDTEKRPGWFARLLGASEPTTISSEWFWALPVEPPDIDAIAVGIETMGETIPKEREQRLRRLFWWNLNNRYRGGKRSPYSVSTAILDRHEKVNLDRLLKLSRDDAGKPTFETVEILRELGQFDESQHLLEQLDSSTPGLEILAQRIADKDSRVCVVQESAYTLSSQAPA